MNNLKHWRRSNKIKTPCELEHLKTSCLGNGIFGKLVEKEWHDLCPVCKKAWLKYKKRKKK